MSRLVSVVLCMVSVGCGSSITSVDGDQKTNALAPADKAQLCTDTYNYVVNAFSVDDLAKLACGFQTTSSTDAASCQSSFDKCVADATSQVTMLPPTSPDCTSFNTSIAKCNTTVGQYTQCLAEAIDMAKALEDSAPFCSTAEITAASIGAIQNMSLECIQLLSTCTISFAPTASFSSDAPSQGG